MLFAVSLLADVAGAGRTVSAGRDDPYAGTVKISAAMLRRNAKRLQVIGSLHWA
jgi:hypothetical protein